MSASQRDALCQALHAALAGRVEQGRLLPLADAGANQGDPLRITLRLTRADTRTIEGYLQWHGAGKPAMTGPPVTLSVDDAPLQPSQYPSFAFGLLQVSKLPL